MPLKDKNVCVKLESKIEICGLSGYPREIPGAIHMRKTAFTAVYLSCLFSCIGYGITFALFAIMVNSTGVSGIWLGINAALPALGWIIGSLLIPILQLQFRIGIKKIAITCLLIGIAGLCIPLYFDDYFGLSLTRFVFGGAMGVFLRCVEYIIVANSPTKKRGQFLAIYGAIFMTGMIVGSIIQPELENSNNSAIFLVFACLGISALIFGLAKIEVQLLEVATINLRSLSLIPLLPIAFLGVIAYSLYEAVPAYLLQIFALRNGLGETIAAYTLSAAALGNLLLLYPLLWLSDRVGRVRVLSFCALAAALIPIAITLSLQHDKLFLSLVALLGAAAGASYGLSLAMLGDRFTQASLILANAIFGILYSTGSIFGPLLHGIAIELAGNNGLMYSVSAVFSLLVVAIAVMRFTEKPGQIL